MQSLRSDGSSMFQYSSPSRSASGSGPSGGGCRRSVIMTNILNNTNHPHSLNSSRNSSFNMRPNNVSGNHHSRRLAQLLMNTPTHTDYNGTKYNHRRESCRSDITVINCELCPVIFDVF